MEHTLHLAASHFAQALQIPSIMQTNASLEELAAVLDDKLFLEIDDSDDIAADEVDADAIANAHITEFEAGDIVGKVLAFIAQVNQFLSMTLFVFLTRDLFPGSILRPCSHLPAAVMRDQWLSSA